jgi:hypothetical protein
LFKVIKVRSNVHNAPLKGKSFNGTPRAHPPLSPRRYIASAFDPPFPTAYFVTYLPVTMKILTPALSLALFTLSSLLSPAQESTEPAAAAPPTPKTFEFAGWSLTATNITPGLSDDGKDIVLSATGNPLTIRKVEKDSDIIATASKIEFNHTSQTMTLSGKPTLKQGFSKMVATDNSTTIQITFGEKFNFSIKGPHRIELAP